MTTNQIAGLNRQARKYLLENCISKRGFEVIAWGFTGYLNSNEVEGVTLIRIKSKWKVFNTNELILSIKGEIDFFSIPKTKEV